MTTASVSNAPAPSPEAPAALGAVRDLVDAPMRAAVGRLAPSVQQVAAYHFGWVDSDGLPQDAHSGKAVRPALAVLAAQAVGARPEIGIPGAIAVELVHNFSLLHDDVMDRDEERRHRPTAWTVFGSSAAILAGDALLALAFEVLLDVDSPASRAAQANLATATQDLIVGQVEDLDFERRLDVGVEECLRMAAGKTAALMACAASIGAQLAAAPVEVVAALQAYGRELGLAFQLVDDMLGIWGSSPATGKPVFSDLASRKKTLPVTWAVDNGGNAGADLALWLRRGVVTPPSDHELRGVAELVERSGARAWARDEAHRRVACAADALAGSPLREPFHRELLELAAFVVERQS